MTVVMECNVKSSAYLLEFSNTVLTATGGEMCMGFRGGGWTILGSATPADVAAGYRLHWQVPPVVLTDGTRPPGVVLRTLIRAHDNEQLERSCQFFLFLRVP